MTDKLLNPKETAEYLGLSVSWLTKWRSRGSGPAYVKIGSGARGRIRYRESDLRTFIEERARGVHSADPKEA